MTPERFAELADAYGANLRRWPKAEREAARRLLDVGDGQLLATWQRASWLDGQLDSYQVPVTDTILVRSIVARGPAPNPAAAWSTWGTWLSRIGLLGAGLAGLATGMLLVSLSMPRGPSVDSEVLPSIFDHSGLKVIYGNNSEEIEQ